MQTALHTLTKHLARKQIFHINDDGSKLLVLERFNLFSIANGPRIVLHRFVHSDPDRGYHDHPWSFGISLILNGSYREIKVRHESLEKKERVFSPGSINYLDGKDY